MLSSWEVAADVPTRLARARCHLAAKKTVPSAPSSSPPVSPGPTTVVERACTRAPPPRGSDTKLLSATENAHRLLSLSARALLLTHRRRGPVAIRPRESWCGIIAQDDSLLQIRTIYRESVRESSPLVARGISQFGEKREGRGV